MSHCKLVGIYTQDILNKGPTSHLKAVRRWRGSLETFHFEQCNIATSYLSQEDGAVTKQVVFRTPIPMSLWGIVCDNR